MKSIWMFAFCVLLLANVSRAQQTALQHDKFLKFLKTIPPDQLSVFKKLASTMFTGNQVTFTDIKDPMQWATPIQNHLEKTVNSFSEDDGTKKAALAKIRFMVKFLINSIKQKKMPI